jgi:ribonuclease HI
MSILYTYIKIPPSANNNYSVIRGSNQFDEDSYYLLQFDGLSEPNPGVSTAGSVLFSPGSRSPVIERGEFIDFATNNQAEYIGLIIGLKSAIELGIKELLIEGDSRLVIFQTEGKWKIKNEGLKPLLEKVKELLTHFTFIGLRHIYRKNNKYADKITNNVLKSRESYSKNLIV